MAGPKILYAEDDPTLRYITKENLERKGYEVLDCENGKTGLECFSEKKPDICILDVMMPELDGFSLARKIRETNHDVPILFVTAKSMKEDRIEGLANFPNKDGIGVQAVSFRGLRIPPEGEVPKLKKSMFGDPVELFNGRDLNNWELADAGAVSGWKAVDGVMLNNPEQKKGEAHIQYGNLRTRDSFEDFNLKLEVNVPEGSNSGVYLRGIYEVQVMDSYGKELDPHNMGALYSRITPSEAAEKPAGEWQKMDITLYKRYITVKLNGKTIIDNQPVKGVTGGALTSDQFSPGPILLQGDHGKVSYRNMVLRPIVEK